MKYGILWLLAAATALYLLFPCAVFETDAVIYASAGLSGDKVQSTDAGHLAWGFLELGAAGLGRDMMPPSNPIYLLRYLAVLASLAGGWVFYRLARESGMSSGAAFTATGLLVFSYSYWHFGLQAEPHLLSTFFLICFAWSGFRYFQGGSLGQVFLAGIFLSLATLFHQTSILLVPAFLVPAWWRERSWKRTLPVTAIFLFVYFMLVIVPYLAVGWFVRDLRSWGEFRDWILGLSLANSWGYWSLKSLPTAVVGAGRSLVGSHYMLGIGWIESLALRIFPAASWDDEIAIAQTVPPVLRFSLLAIQAGFFLAVIAGLWRGLRRRCPLMEEHGAFALFLGIWLMIYTPFIIWWAPIRAEFWVAVFLPLLLLIGQGMMASAHEGSKRRALPALLVGALVATNLMGSILPQSRADVEPELGRLVAIEAVIQPGDFLLSDSSLMGRATKFAYSLDKVNLLDPSPYRSSHLSPGDGRTPRVGMTPESVGLIPIPDSDDPVVRALGVVSAVLDIAEREGRSVYLVMGSIMGASDQADGYAKIVKAVADTFGLSESVRVRADVDLKRILITR
ncbi:MAG: glycosyltransferase family 39 protein [Gemmatimonadales bacterium]|nr:glycosyltransferase family 39 protein [Gemmatimonadales bacterium]